MKTCIDCIPCIVGQGVHYAKKSAQNPAQAEAMVNRMLESLLAFGHELPPPVMAREIHAIAKDVCGDHDHYLEAKDNSTRIAKEILESIKGELEAQPDQFEAIVRLAIAGNIIDFGAYRDFDLNTARGRIVEAFSASVDEKSIVALRDAMAQARNILYIADNCGEAVFDRLLIEPYRLKTTLVVRGNAILNDLTRRELADSGLDDGFVAKVVDTGDFTPGISFEHSSKEFLEVFESADLIISKGQGNYETLSETDRPIFFLLRAKCQVIAEHLGGVAQGSFQVIGSNMSQLPRQGRARQNCAVEEFAR